MNRPLPAKCCLRCQAYQGPSEDYHGRADMGLCHEYNEETNERDCCGEFEMHEDDLE